MAEDPDGSALLPEFSDPATRTRSFRIATCRPLILQLSTLILNRPVGDQRRTRGSIPFLEVSLTPDVDSVMGRQLINQSHVLAIQQSHGPASVVLEADYADELVVKSYEQQIVVQKDMFLPDPSSSERAHGKPKPESRFYNFLHRSRSRSRSASRSRASSPLPPVPPEPLPHHQRDSTASGTERPTSSVMSSPSSNKTTRAGTKPTSRIPSRPLSSTTTATNTTNTTITPRTPTQSRMTKPRSMKPLEAANELRGNARFHQAPLAPPPPPPPSKPTGARQKLHNLFGLPLSGTRKMSFSSRPNSPGPLGHSHDPEESTPLPSQHSRKPQSGSIDYKASQSTASSSQSQSWTTSSNTHSQSTNDERKPTRTGSGSKLVMFLRGRSSSRTRTQPPQDHNPSSSSLSTPPVVSAPILPKSKTHRRSGLGGSLDSSHSRVTATSSANVELPVPLPSSNRYNQPPNTASPPVATGIPRIMTTPATPVKVGTSIRPPPASRLDTIESGGAWQPMTMVDEEGRLGRHPEDSGYAEPTRQKSRSSGKGRERRRPASSSGNAGQGQGTNPSTRGSGPPKSHLTSRGTKHGSFDFERPGWSGIISGKASTMARSVSGGSTSGGSALTSRTGGSGVNQSRESVAGNCSTTRSVLGRRGTRDTASRTNGQDKGKNIPTAPLEPEHTGSSTHTTASSGGGLNSSFGRSSGRKVVGGISKLLGGGGHGPFPFEPPVPSPTLTASTNPSPSSTGGFAQQQLGTRIRGLEADTAIEPRGEPGRQRVGFGLRGKGQGTTAIPIPNQGVGNKSAGYRSAVKGRSLDLGLGLAWAPSKVKEDALLPFGRSLSVSRRGENGRAQREVRAAAESDTDLSKAGRDIAEIFRTVLDEDAYAAFKSYVRRFDAKQIPLDGPSGIIACVERLLLKAPGLDDAGKDRLLDTFLRIILQSA